jgi:anti-anti-sigma factor
MPRLHRTGRPSSSHKGGTTLNSSSGSGIEATPAPRLEVLYPQADAAVVVLHGEHDLATKDELRQTLTELLDTQQLVVVDVSVTEFVDSSVLGEFVRAHNKANEDGKQFRVQYGTKSIVKRVFEITGLLSVFEWYPTRDEALQGRRQTMKQPDQSL